MASNNKVPYNNLSEEDKNNIVKAYYENINIDFKSLSNKLLISERAFSRVLQERGINTKRKQRYTLNEGFFKKIDNEEKAYILGLLYADGFVGNERYNNIVLGLKDKDIIETIANIIEYTGRIRIGNKGSFVNSHFNFIINISSKEMATDLRYIGLYPNKSLTMSKLPDIPEYLNRHFIRGYFDGDGSILISSNTSYYRRDGFEKKYKYFTYAFSLLGTEPFLLEIARIINSRYISIRNTKTKEIKELRICAKCEAKNIYDFLYKGSSIYLERKHNKWLQVLSAIAK